MKGLAFAGEKMKGNIYKISAFLTLMLLTLSGCTASISTNTGNPTTNTTSANSAPKANSNTVASNKSDSPSEKLKNSKKPESEKGKSAKNIEVPKDWITIYDDKKGYSFSVPDGSTGGNDTFEGVDIFLAETPAPSELAIAVLAFNDKEMTKEDLLNFAVEFMKGFGATTVETEKLAAESEEYALTVAVATLPDGSKSKSKILVGTDVSDNYVMIIGTEEPKFAANEKIIDEIWGSFEMWSGGASSK